MGISACGGGSDDDAVKQVDLSKLDFTCVAPGIPTRVTEYKNGAYSSITKFYESKKLACTTVCTSYGSNFDTSSFRY
jgi:hypothetical protein